MAIVGLKNLCAPAYVYLVISCITMIVMIIQNFGNNNIYCVGSYTCDVSSTAIIFVIKTLYILFWTWVLNLICKSGSPSIAWFLVLLPFILFFVFVAFFFIK
jgi:hypothetical protein